MVDEITIGSFWAVIRRGPSELDPASFRVADLYHDHYGLTPRVTVHRRHPLAGDREQRHGAASQRTGIVGERSREQITEHQRLKC